MCTNSCTFRVGDPVVGATVVGAAVVGAWPRSHALTSEVMIMPVLAPGETKHTPSCASVWLVNKSGERGGESAIERVWV